MIIKCPQCSTGYDIPDTLLTDKPRKMRCTKCKNVFTVVKKSENSIDGYVEFTGRQYLPSEFAFLQQESSSFEKNNSSHDSAREPKQQPQAETAALPSEPGAQPASAAQPAPAAPQAEPSVKEQGNTAVSVRSKSEKQRFRPVSQPAESLFNSNVKSPASWEIEDPLELGGYTMAESSGTVQTIGKIVFGFILLIIGFFIFVAARNGWTLSTLELSDQIAFAFSDKTLEALPDTVKKIEATVSKKSIITGRNNKLFLSVVGEVINNNPTSRSHIIVKGELIDSNGNTRAMTRVPCGRVTEEDVIKKTKAGSVALLYRSGGDLYNCHIGPDDSTIFQIIFENVPSDYNAAFKVKVTPVAATFN
jgi:predicted Zn finger-like uncharacterized protein